MAVSKFNDQNTKTGQPAVATAALPDKAIPQSSGEPISKPSCVGSFDEALRSGNVYFGTSSALLRKDAVVVLERLTSMITQCNEVKIEVVGHTDNDGKKDFNLRLSIQRAQAVANYFKRRGIDSTRIHYRGVGITKPAVPNDSRGHKAMNRRAELVINN